MTMPAPESRSTPDAPMSRAVLARKFRTSATVKLGLYDRINAAIAAAWGAAVPGKGWNPWTLVETRSAAAMSGFWRSAPPLEEKSPEVIAVPSGWKKTCLGPSELNVSTETAGPAVNGLGETVEASTAAT